MRESSVVAGGELLRLGGTVVKRITLLELGLNDGSGNGRSSFEIEVRAVTAKLTNTRSVSKGQIVTMGKRRTMSKNNMC